MFFFHFLYVVTLQKSSVFSMVHILPWKQNEWFYFSNQWEHQRNYCQNFLGLRVSLFVRQDMSSFKYSSESLYFVWLGSTESLWSYFLLSPSTGPLPFRALTWGGDSPQMCGQGWGWLCCTAKGGPEKPGRWCCGRNRAGRRGGALCPLTPVTTPSQKRKSATSNMWGSPVNSKCLSYWFSSSLQCKLF